MRSLAKEFGYSVFVLPEQSLTALFMTLNTEALEEYAYSRVNSIGRIWYMEVIGFSTCEKHVEESTCNKVFLFYFSFSR